MSVQLDILDDSATLLFYCADISGHVSIARMESRYFVK